PTSALPSSPTRRSSDLIHARPCDRRPDAVFDDKEALGRTFAGTPAAVVLVDVASQKAGAVRIGASDEQGVHAAHVGGETRREQRDRKSTRLNSSHGSIS